MEIFVRIVENTVIDWDGHLQDIGQCLLLLREARGWYPTSAFCVITSVLIRNRAQEIKSRIYKERPILAYQLNFRDVWIACICSAGDVAHMVERSLCMREVRGSIPRFSISYRCALLSWETVSLFFVNVNLVRMMTISERLQFKWDPWRCRHSYSYKRIKKHLK